MNKKAVPRNDDQYKYLSAEFVIRDADLQLDAISHQANNLYNAALYQLRQQWIKHRKWRNYVWLDTLFKAKYQRCENMLYGAFPYRQSAQQTLKEVATIWDAWSKALKSYRKNPHKFSGKPRMPGYLPKGKRHIFYVTSQNAKVKDNYLIIQPRNHSLDLKVKLYDDIKTVKRVALKPLSKCNFKVIIQYATNQQIHYKTDNQRYLGIDPGLVGIDPGLDNAFTCASNDPNVRPLIINGRGTRHVN